MAHMLVRHKVSDVDKWKVTFESHGPAQAAAGLKVAHVWRNEGDPSEVIVLFEASDMAKAKEFANSVDLMEKMKEAGVLGKPDVVFLSEI